MLTINYRMIRGFLFKLTIISVRIENSVGMLASDFISSEDILSDGH